MVTRQQNEIRSQCDLNDQICKIFENFLEKKRCSLAPSEADQRAIRDLEHLISKITRTSARLQELL